MGVRNITKKQLIEYIENLGEDDGILYISIKGIKDKKLAKKLHKLGASFSLEDSYNYMDEYYDLLYHATNISQIQFSDLLEELKNIKILGKKFSFETFPKSEHEKNIERRIKEQKEQKEFWKIFKPNKNITKIIRNNLTDNVYKFYIDTKNKLYLQVWGDRPPSLSDKIYKYKNLDQFRS